LQKIKIALERWGFQIEISPFRTRENVCVYYTVKNLVTPELREKVEYIAKIVNPYLQTKLRLKKVRTPNREREIKIKLR